MDPNKGEDTAAMMNDDQDSSDWMSANEIARSESLTSLSGTLTINDDTASSPIKRPSDQWEQEEEEEQIIDHIEHDANQEEPPFTIPLSLHEQQEQEQGREKELHSTIPISQQTQQYQEEIHSQPQSPSPPPPPTAEEQGLARPSGASLFSVPPSSAPHSGVYDMPLEAFEIKDLDSGKTFSLDKRLWIKDRDTGKVYVVEPEDPEDLAKFQGGGGGVGGGVGGGGSRVASASGRSTPGTTSSVRVSDLISGQELTLEEFEEALGYSRQPPPFQYPSPGGDDEDDDDEDEMIERDLAAQAQLMAQRGLHSLSLAASASANWFKGKAAAAKERISSSRDHSSGFHSAGGGSAGNFGASPRSLGDASPTSIASSSRAADGQGLPVKVNVSKKPFKELTDLRLVQTVAAHQGVVWTMRFSKSGRYLATAGQDCVIAVWEVVLHRERERSGVELGPVSVTTNTRIENNINDPSSAPDSPVGSDTTANTAGTANNPTGSVYGVPVLRSRPSRLYRGHKQDILDLAWSRTNFLLSASMDKTVRLWHVSMDECLRVFKHTDFVTAIDFHPSDDKLFVSGSIDGKVRLWNVPEQRVVSWQDVHDMVTAVSYSRDGRKAVVGTMRGKCRFYSVSSKGTLEYEAQVDVKNKRGQHARGKKVTGLYFAPSLASSSGSSSGAGGSSKGVAGSSGGGSTTGRSSSHHSAGASTSAAAAAAAAGGASGSAGAGSTTSDAAASSGSLLITSNDSRVRLYDGYTLRTKYKGHSNKSTQIKASFSPKGDYVICGSDDGLAYIWSTRKTAVPGSPERNISASSFKNTSTSIALAGGGGGANTSSSAGAVIGPGSGYLDRISPLIRPGSAHITTNTTNTTTATTTTTATGDGAIGGAVKDPVAKEKNASYESFQVANDVITVALFGPECTHRPLDNFSPTALAAAEEAAAGGALTMAQAQAQAAVGSSSGGGSSSLGGATTARGQVILAAGYSGEIKIYENIGLPQWL